MTKDKIRHMVLFNLHSGVISPETEKFLRDGQKILTSIPVVRNFEVLRQVSQKTDYDFGFSMEFDSQTDYETYNGHPAHIDFVKQRWEKEVERFLEIDFKAL